MKSLDDVAKEGFSEGKLRDEWEAQRKEQGKEGELEAATRRREEYEQLGELMALWDQVKIFLSVFVLNITSDT